MSLVASHKPEAIVALLFEQALNFELRFCGAPNRNSQVPRGLSNRRMTIKVRFDQHERRAAQNSVDQKEILETIRVNRRNPPPFHSHALPAVKCAKGKTSTRLTYVASELSRPPTKCGDMCAQVDSSFYVPHEGTQ